MLSESLEIERFTDADIADRGGKLLRFTSFSYTISYMKVLDRTRTSVIVKMPVAQYRMLEDSFVYDDVTGYEFIFSEPMKASDLLP